MAITTFTLTIQMDAARPNPQRIAAQTVRDVANVIEVKPTLAGGTLIPGQHSPASTVWTVT
jgi:hypothetical protein